MSTTDLLMLIFLVLACWVAAIMGWALLRAHRRAQQVAATHQELVMQLQQAQADHQRAANEEQIRAVERLAAAQSESRRLGAALTSVTTRHEQTAKGLAEAESESRRLSVELQRFSKIVDIERACEEAKIVLATVRKDADDLKYRSEKDLRNSISQLQAEVVEVQQNAGLQKDRARNEIDDLKRRIAQLSTELAGLEEKDLLQSFGFYHARYDFVSSEAYKRGLAENRERQKEMIRDRTAATCRTAWTIDGSTKKGEKHTSDFLKLMLRGFNGESDACVAQVKYNNVHVMESRIQKCFEAINKLSSSHTSEISRAYLELKLGELHLMHEFQEKRQEEAEEQRRIREQIRDEEKAQAELEKVRREAENEERRYEAALAKARSEAEGAVGARQEKLVQEIERLQQRLSQAHEVKERAVSRAQQTRSGHVYIISNVGSFGDDVYKIGMTRREDPLDRIRELGDASVPFQFDIHAIIQTEDAPSLENALHRAFHTYRVNRVNERKEFFRVTLSEIEQIVLANHGKIEFTRLAEAVEYRKTLSMLAEGPELSVRRSLGSSKEAFV